MPGVAHAVSAEKVAGSSICVLSPRLYAALTSGTDGAGISLRLEEEVRKRARQEWLATGNEDSTHNWLAAESRTIKTLNLPQPGHSIERPGCNQEIVKEQPQADQKLVGDSATAAEVQWLRQRVAALTAELKKDGIAPAQKLEAPPQTTEVAEPAAEPPSDEFSPREDPELAKFRESMSRINCLKLELAATDKMLVDRNDEFRKLEMHYDNAKQKLRVQADELARREAEQVAAEAGRVEAEQHCVEAEQRCAEKESRIEELNQKVNEQDTLIQALQHQLLDKDSKSPAAKPRAPQRKGWKPSGKDINAIHQSWNRRVPVHAAA